MNKIVFANGVEITKYESRVLLSLLSGKNLQVIEITKIWNDSNLKKYSSACESLQEKKLVSRRTRKHKRRFSLVIPSFVNLCLSNIDMLLDDEQTIIAEKRIKDLIKTHYSRVWCQKIDAIGFWERKDPLLVLRSFLTQISEGVFEIKLRPRPDFKPSLEDLELINKTKWGKKK